MNRFVCLVFPVVNKLWVVYWISNTVTKMDEVIAMQKLCNTHQVLHTKAEKKLQTDTVHIPSFTTTTTTVIVSNAPVKNIVKKIFFGGQLNGSISSFIHLFIYDTNA